MKKLLLLSASFIFACSSNDEELPFYVAENGVTIKAREIILL